MRVTRLGVAALAILVFAASACGDASAGGQRGARVIALSVDSKAVGRKLPMRIVVPAGAEAGPERPLVVFLHGRSGNARSELGEPLFRALAALGRRAPVVAFPDGGDHSYWHDRRGGDWGRYVVDEVIPAVGHRVRVDTARVAIGGISMGGFGAFDLARLHPHRFCAAGGHSPALWQSAGETAPGAFDDAADFGRHDVIRAARAGRFSGLRLWLDAGSGDPFRPGDRAFAAATGLRLRTWTGGHDGAYWNRHLRDYLRFYARVLARCTPAGS
jgi:poly(3-hydroxybutyrate) depolymerase